MATQTFEVINQGSQWLVDTLWDTANLSIHGTLSQAIVACSINGSGFALSWVTVHVKVNGQEVGGFNPNDSFGTSFEGSGNYDCTKYIKNGANRFEMYVSKGTGELTSVSGTMSLTMTETGLGSIIPTNEVKTTPTDAITSFFNSLTATGKWIEYVLIIIVVLVTLYLIWDSGATKAINQTIVKE